MLQEERRPVVCAVIGLSSLVNQPSSISYIHLRREILIQEGHPMFFGFLSASSCLRVLLLIPYAVCLVSGIRVDGVEDWGDG